jgi:DNA end-binding protein Ku
MPATVWKGYLSFGLVSFPIRLNAAARPETVHFHMLHKKDLSRVKEVFYCAAEDKPLDKDEIVKGYEYAKGDYVIVEPSDLEKIAPPTAKVMEILQFVKAAEVDPLFFEKSYYVAPEGEVLKPYALLMEAMVETGQDAIAKVAMHGREHIVILRPMRDAIVLHTIYYKEELNEANKTTVDAGAFNKRELDLAKQLVHSLSATFEPEQYKDQYRENIERMIEQKREGRKVTAAKQPKTPRVVSILDALKKSLEETKPVNGAGKKARPSSGKRTQRKRSAA